MAFAAGQTKTLQVGYILPMSFAGFITRKPEELEKLRLPPQYEKPWHERVELCMVLYFSYITETGRSWVGPIDKATFRVSNTGFEHCLRKFSEYAGGNPADLPPGTSVSGENPADRSPGKTIPGEDPFGTAPVRWQTPSSYMG